MKTIWMLCYLLKRYPIYVIGFFFDEVMIALPQYVANVLFLKYMIQALLEKKPLSQLVILLIGVAVFLIVADVYMAFFANEWKPCAEERIHRDFHYKVRQAAENYEMEIYDNPVFYDDMTYVSEHIAEDSLALLHYAGKLVASCINIVLIISLFYKIGIGVLLISGSAVVFSAFFEAAARRLINEKKFETNSRDRKRAYFRNCFFERRFVQDRKLTTISSLLQTKYDECIGEQIFCEKRYGKKLFLLSSLKEIVSSHILMNFILFVYLLYETLVKHTLSGSDFIATYNGVMVIMSAITEVVMIFGQMAEKSFTVGKYQKLISEMPEKMCCENADFEMIESIEFRNVSFSYWGTDNTVLNDISFCIHTGERIAIVGRNGSGKTTLTHLLMGLYYPTKGDVLVNGRKLEKKEYLLYRRKFAAFFQGMKPFEATIAENVALDTEVNYLKVHDALERTNCEKLLMQSPDKVIGVEFDSNGMLLSGGEYQKLMLSYCFYSDKSLIIMDEPNSALDPVAERDFNRQIYEMSAGKLVIFVTHRLSTVHMADHIYVIDEGKLCDQGSHEELVRKDGVYKEMWKIQSEKYCSGV